MLPHLARMSAAIRPMVARGLPLLFAQQSSAKLPGFLLESIGFWTGFPYEGD